MVVRRSLTSLAGAAAACLALTGMLGLSVANAADPLTGRLVDATVASHPGAPNMTVRLREVAPSGPGTIVSSDVSDASGSFSLDAGPAPDDEYYVQVVAGNYQGGWHCCVGRSQAMPRRDLGPPVLVRWRV